MQYYDAIFIQFTGEDGSMHNIIVDGGNFRQCKYCYTDRIKEKLALLFGKGESIDLWVVTHIDNDHIGGLYHFINDKDFFERYCGRLKEVWINYGGNGDYNVQKTGTIGYHEGKELRELLNEKHVSVKQSILAAYTVTLSDATIIVVAPNERSMNRYIEWWYNMEFKDVKKLSNSEIAIYKETLKNEFDVLKHKIKELCDEIQKIDNEYQKANNELTIRQRNIY